MPQTSINSTCYCLAWPPNSNDHSSCNKVIVPHDSPLQILIHFMNYQKLIVILIYSTKMDKTHKCCLCHKTPTILARAKCGHTKVCLACTKKLTSQRLYCACPTCGDPFLGFTWHLLTHILESMRWKQEMEVFQLTANQEDTEYNYYIPMYLEGAPFPPVPALCTRCKREQAVFYEVEFLQRWGTHISFCGRCALACITQADEAPLNTPEVITLE